MSETTTRREPVNPFPARVDDGHFVAEWREDGRWWSCIHRHRTEVAAEVCGVRIRKSRSPK